MREVMWATGHPVPHRRGGESQRTVGGSCTAGQKGARSRRPSCGHGRYHCLEACLIGNAQSSCMVMMQPPACSKPAFEGTTWQTRAALSGVHLPGLLPVCCLQIANLTWSSAGPCNHLGCVLRGGQQQRQRGKSPAILPAVHHAVPARGRHCPHPRDYHLPQVHLSKFPICA